MSEPQTYHGYLSSIAGNPEAIKREQQRLERLASRIADQIREKLTPKTVPALLWWLAVKDIERTSQLVEIPVTDAAGHGQYLRALCAAIPFSNWEPSSDPNAESLLKLCKHLWDALFFREMIEELGLIGLSKVERWQQTAAAMTSLLKAFQCELVYVEQIEDRVKRIFGPFSSDIIFPSLGITTDDAIIGFRKIRHLVEARVNSGHTSAELAKSLWEEYEQLADQGATQETLDSFVFNHPNYETVKSGLADSYQQVYKVLLFSSADLSPELGNKASAFFEAFSFQPGKANLQFNLPSDDDVVRSRPFARIGEDAFVLFDVHYGSFSPPHRFRECFDIDPKLQRLNKRRDKSLEDEAARLFSSVIGAELCIQSYYIPLGTTGDFAERDLLVFKDGCLFLVESKARALRPLGSRRDKLARLEADVKRTIQEGYNQACDVIRYLRNSSGQVSLFDASGSSRQVLATLKTTEVHEIIPIVFLDSYYGYIATDLKPWIRLDESVGFPWVVDRDTFESILLKVDTFQKLKSFLLWRRGLHGFVVNEDEAVFAGAFLRHGPFELPQKTSSIQLTPDYGDIFEAEYFRRKGFDVELPPENTGPPVWLSMQKKGDEIVSKIDGKYHESINVNTGQTYKKRKNRRQQQKPGRIGRNDPCPCGSGKKYKKCCIPEDG